MICRPAYPRVEQNFVSADMGELKFNLSADWHGSLCLRVTIEFDSRQLWPSFERSDPVRVVVQCVWTTSGPQLIDNEYHLLPRPFLLNDNMVTKVR